MNTRGAFVERVAFQWTDVFHMMVDSFHDALAWVTKALVH